jgi:hypothetical protein
MLPPFPETFMNDGCMDTNKIVRKLAGVTLDGLLDADPGPWTPGIAPAGETCTIRRIQALIERANEVVYC